MKGFKAAVAAIIICAALTFGSPVSVKASEFYEMPPAVVFIKDKNSNMLLKHNFVFDDEMGIIIDSNIDNGFNADIR